MNGSEKRLTWRNVDFEPLTRRLGRPVLQVLTSVGTAIDKRDAESSGPVGTIESDLHD